MKTYKNFLFDMDDTLKDFTNEDKIILNKIHKILKIDNTIRCKFLNLINKLAFMIKNTGLIKTNLNILDVRLKLYSKFLGVSLSKYSKEYYKVLDEVVVLFAGTTKVIKTLIENNCNIFIITNNPTSKKIAIDLGVPILNIYVLSKEENKEKIISRIIKEKNLDKELTVMVGDNLIEDIYSAKKNNIDTIWINYNDRLFKLFSGVIKPNHIISKIDSIIKFI